MWGRRLVVLAGQRKAIANAVRGIKGRRRCSMLRELLCMPDAEFATVVRRR